MVIDTSELYCAEYRIAHMPIGYLLDLALASYWKRILLTVETGPAERLKFLNDLAECAHGLIGKEAVAAIDPICGKGWQILSEILSLPVEKQTQAFGKGDVFRILARLNPSLLTALGLCDIGPVPDAPRYHAVVMQHEGRP